MNNKGALSSPFLQFQNKGSKNMKTKIEYWLKNYGYKTKVLSVRDKTVDIEDYVVTLKAANEREKVKLGDLLPKYFPISIIIWR